MANKKLSKQLARRTRVRSKMSGSAQKPRISVHRTNKYMYIQAIDDQNQETIAAASTLDAKKGTKTEKAVVSAQELAKQLKAKKVSELIFDRGHYKYHGRVKAVAEALREQGLHV